MVNLYRSKVLTLTYTSFLHIEKGFAGERIMRKLLRFDGINKKVSVLVTGVLLISLLSISFMNYQISKRELDRSNKIILSNAVHTVLAQFERDLSSIQNSENDWTLDGAQENALAFIHKLHGITMASDATSGATSVAENYSLFNYSIDLGESGYFYIIDSKGDIVFHPFLTENLYDLQSADGRYIIQEVIKNAKQGGGYVNYALKEDISIIVDSKTVYANYFEEWDWIVASVIYDTELARGSHIILVYNLFGLAISMAIAIAVTILITRRITKPIKKITKALYEVANGDLTVSKVHVRSMDETKMLGDSLNLLIDRLRNIMQLMKNSSDGLNRFAENLSQSSSIVSESTTEVAKAISFMALSSEDQFRETTDSVRRVHELGDDIDMTAKASIAIKTVIQQSMDLKEEGLSSVNDLKEANHKNNENIQKIEGIIEGINEQSLAVGDITSIITKIARQTNLLALNASIEAARAGEHGMGFAVVADEIRKLASETATATNHIRTRILEMQQQTDEAVTFMSLNHQSMDKINQRVTHTEDVIGRISDGLQGLVKDINLIVEKNLVIHDMKDDIVTMLNLINNTAEENSATIEEISASSEEQSMTILGISESIGTLYEMVQELNNLIHKFTIES